MLNERIRSLRKEKGIEARFIANKLGISNSTYSSYESGRITPSVEKLLEIAIFFDISIDYLLGRTDEKNANREKSPLLDIEDLTNDDIEVVKATIEALKKNRNKK